MRACRRSLSGYWICNAVLLNSAPSGYCKSIAFPFHGRCPLNMSCTYPSMLLPSISDLMFFFCPGHLRLQHFPHRARPPFCLSWQLPSDRTPNPSRSPFITPQDLQDTCPAPDTDLCYLRHCLLMCAVLRDLLGQFRRLGRPSFRHRNQHPACGLMSSSILFLNIPVHPDALSLPVSISGHARCPKGMVQCCERSLYFQFHDFGTYLAIICLLIK